MTHVYRKLAELVDSGRTVALVTVIASVGSTPRKVGSRMLVGAEGYLDGTIGGGPVEKHATDQAINCIKMGKSIVLNYDLGVKAEGGDPGSEEIKSFERLEKEIASPGPAGESDTVKSGAICNGRLAVFIEVFRPVPHLIIIGAGHISTNLALFSRKLEYRVTVVDDLAEYANESRFPGCEIRIGDLGKELARIDGGSDCYFVIVTRGHQFDKTALEILSRKQWAYLGMIGSASKIKATFSALIAGGVPKEKLRQVRAPIGLDIGGQTPEEIALSILAEMQTTRYSQAGASGKPLFLKHENLIWPSG